MAKLGTDKRPAVVRVNCEEHAQEIMSISGHAGIKIIVGIEPDKPENLFDLKKALKIRKYKFKLSFS